MPLFVPVHSMCVFHQCWPGVPKSDSRAVDSGTNTPMAASMAQRPWINSRSRSFMMSRCAPIWSGSHPTSPGISPVRYGGTTPWPVTLSNAAGRNFLRRSP